MTIFRFSFAASVILLLFGSCGVYAESSPPTVVPPIPSLTVDKDSVAGDVVLVWTSTATPYSVVRCTHADFTGTAPPPEILSAGLTVTTFRDGVLNDGVSYFYSVEDDNAPTRVFGMVPDSGLPGESVTLTGFGFASSSLSDNQVFVGGEPAIVTDVTDTTLTFAVPAGAVTGSVVASTSKGASGGGHTLLTTATSGLSAISSLAVDAAHVLFVSDTGGAATSDRVYKVDPATGLRTQVGYLNEATGLPADFATPNRLYYGNALVNSYNYGTIERTDSTGNEIFYRTCGNSATADLCHVFAIGLDPFLTDYGPEGRVYVADGAIGKQKVRIVPQFGAVTDFATGFTFGGAPRGVVVNVNSASPFFHDVFVADSTTVRQYTDSVPGVLQKTYDSSNSPIVTPGQMAITEETAGPPATERLLVADRGRNRIVMINPATDRSKTIDVPLESPRGVALDKDASGRTFAYVGEPTRIVKFPVYKTVYIAPWIADGAPISEPLVRQLVMHARTAFEMCGIDLQIRDDVVRKFAPPTNLLDLEINDWTTATCGGFLSRTEDEEDLLDDSRWRSSEPTDLNIYFVRNLTVGDSEPPHHTIGETVTADCFPDVSDGINSGVIISASKVTDLELRPHTIRTLAHEIGHALIERISWGGDEHRDADGIICVEPNVMNGTITANSRDFDADQCSNINTDLTIFRGDP